MSGKKDKHCIRGLYRKRGGFVFQPPMVDGVRPSAIHLEAKEFPEAVLEVEKLRNTAALDQALQETADLAELYLKAKRRSGDHKGKATTITARPSLNRFTKRFPTLRSITRAGILAWRDEMIAERKTVKDKNGKLVETDQPALAVSSWNTYLRYSQSFVRWLVETNRLRKSPFDDLEKLFPKKLPTRRGKGCTKAQRDSLIENCSHFELRAVLMFGFYAGLRRNEILNLRPDWLLIGEDGRPTHIHVQSESGADGTSVFTIKDDDEKIIPMPDPLVEFVVENDLLKRSPYLIAPEIAHGEAMYRWHWNNRWQTYMASQGMPGFTPHMMRHTFVTLLLSAPPASRPSLLHLARWTGDDVDTLIEHYGHLLDDPSLINAAN